MLKRMLAALLVLCALALLLPAAVGAATGDLRVEQALTLLPEGKAFFYIEGETSNTANVSVALENNDLTVTDVRRADPAEDPADYIFIVDGSAGYAQMQAMKDAITAFVDRWMADGDKLTLVVAGSEARTLLEKAQNKEEIKTAVSGLYGSEYGQTLFDAMAGCLDVTTEESDALRRKVAFVFTSTLTSELDERSDGEIAGAFGAGGLPYYTFAFEGGSEETAAGLGVLARATGASFSLTDEANFDNAFSSVAKEIQEAFVAEFAADSNRIGGSPQTLQITDNLSGEEASLEAPVRFWTPDAEAPTIRQISQTAADTIELVFSEAVEGAGEAGSYRLRTDTGEALPLAGVSYRESDLTALLTLEAPQYEGRLTVECPGVTDRSREENPLAGSATLHFSGEAPAAEGQSPWPWLLLAGAVVLVLVTAVILLRRRGGAVAARVGSLRGQSTPNPPEESAPSLPASGGWLELEGSPGKRVELPGEAPLFCGSDVACQLCLEGEALSRQHFAIEATPEGYLLTPLSASGVTALNGAPVTAPTPLSDGDRIEAGGMVFVFQIR